MCKHEGVKHSGLRRSKVLSWLFNNRVEIQLFGTDNGKKRERCGMGGLPSGCSQRLDVGAGMSSSAACLLLCFRKRAGRQELEYFAVGIAEHASSKAHAWQ